MIDVDLDKLKLALRKLDNGSAPGISGWSGSLLRAISKVPSCLEGLACIVSDICNGVFEGASRARLLRSRLVAIPKKNGAVRPIAIGECLYRLAALYCLSLFKPSDCLPSIQLGVGHRGGSERALHLIRAAMELHGETAVVITTDWQNAFNSRSRTDVMSAFLASASCAPSHRLFHWAYSTPTELCVFGDGGALVDSIMSEQGVRQGDPLASLAFCLSVQPIYERCAAAAPPNEVSCVAICDDFYIVGQYASALACFDAMRVKCDESHFRLNTDDGKCQILVPANHNFARDSDLAARSLVKTTALSALGSFVCFDRSADAAAAWHQREIVDKNAVFFERLGAAAIPLQAALSILSTCGIPRCTYRLRTLTLAPASRAAEAFDDIVHACLKRLLDISDSDLASSIVAQQQLTLPLDHAGIGAKMSLASLSSAALASRCLAFQDIFAACVATKGPLPVAESDFTDHVRSLLPLLHDDVHRLHAVLWKWHQQYRELTHFFPAKDLLGFTEFPERAESLFHSFNLIDLIPPRLQAIFYSAKADCALKKLCAEASAEDAARMTSARHRLSSLAFRTDIPDPRCQLSDQDFRLALRLRLGLHLSPEAATGTCPFCPAKTSLASDAAHPIDCVAFRAEHQRTRHNRLVNLIASLSRQDANCEVQTEIRLSSATRHRPDLFITTYKGRSFWSDVQVTRPDSISNRRQAAAKQCHAADTAAQAKVTKYSQLVAQHGGNLDILPLCFETFGAPSQSALKVFALLGESAEAGGASSNSFATFPHLLETAVSVCLQRGNALVISAYLRALASRRHNSSFDASGSLLVANHVSR